MKLTPLEIDLLILLFSPITVIGVSIMERKRKRKEKDDETDQP